MAAGNPMAGGAAFMGMPPGAGAFGAAGMPGFPGFDMNSSMGAFNPYLMAFPQAVAPMMS